MVSVSFHVEAKAEYDAALAWYAARDTEAADDFDAEVTRVTGMMAEFPELGVPFDRRHRCWLLKKYPYGLYYRFVAGGILVVAVSHASQKPGYWKKRV